MGYLPSAWDHSHISANYPLVHLQCPVQGCCKQCVPSFYMQGREDRIKLSTHIDISLIHVSNIERITPATVGPYSSYYRT